MQGPLWSWEDLVSISGGAGDGEPGGEITGICIDSRTARPGDVFVALEDKRDGHEFVGAAFEKGAVCALVSKTYNRKDGDGALVRVKDTLEGLRALAAGARERLDDDARVVAVTGSAGKTSTKELLRLAFGLVGPTHVAEKSYNNHWGVPLSLARMPQSTRFGVFEIGMNHAGEIAPLSKLVRPHVAIVTTIAEVHLAEFKSVEEIARAKAEVFEGLEPKGTAVLNRDNAHFELLSSAAREHGATVVGFGKHKDAQCRLVDAQSGFDTSTVKSKIHDAEINFRIGAPGEHLQSNCLAALAACAACEADVERCAQAFVEFEVPEGRGERLYVSCGEGQVLVIDESYNANPASMRAAIGVLKLLKDGVASRRIVVLGDMLELGDRADALHRELVEPVVGAGVDLVFASGPHMKHLFDALPAKLRGGYASSAEELEPEVVDAVKAGDVVIVKGSLGSKMSEIVRALKIGLSRPRGEL